MSLIDSAARAVGHALDAIVAFAQGRTIDGVRSLAEGTLEMMPADAVHQVIDDAAVRRANAVADDAALAKFGPAKE